MLQVIVWHLEFIPKEDSHFISVETGLFPAGGHSISGIGGVMLRLRPIRL